MARQQPIRVQLGEVLPLEHHAGESGAECFDECVDQLVVLGAANTLVAPAEVERIRQQRIVVGSHVEHHRQGPSRIEAAAGGVQRELADRDPHPTDAEVTEAEHSFSVGHHDDVDLEVTDRVVEQFFHPVTLRPRQEETALAAIDPRPLLARQADGRGVDDR